MFSQPQGARKGISVEATYGRCGKRGQFSTREEAYMNTNNPTSAEELSSEGGQVTDETLSVQILQISMLVHRIHNVLVVGFSGRLDAIDARLEAIEARLSAGGHDR